MITKQAIERLKNFKAREKRRALPDDFNVYVEHQYNIDALDMAIEALSKQCASSEQADTKLFNRGYWLMPGEVFISHNVLNEVLNTIIKSINTEQRKIDSTLVKTAENDEAIRTDDHIADSDKMVDQFREDTKKTDSERVSLSEKEKSNSFLKEPSEEGNSEMNCSDESETVTNYHDLISKRDVYLALVEKGQASKRYKLGETWELNGKEIREVLDALPSAQPEKIPYKKPEIIRCKDCQYRDPEDKKCDHGHGIVWQLPRPDDWFCADGKA